MSARTWHAHRPAWVFAFLAAVLAVAVGLLSAAPAAAAPVAYAYGMGGYAYDAPLLLSAQNAATAHERNSPAGPGVAPGVSHVLIARFGVAANRGVPKFPWTNPAKAPEGFLWRGKPGSTPGSKEGNWHNLKTGESLRPDLKHPGPIGPHSDYRDPSGNWFRIFPDGSQVPK